MESWISQLDSCGLVYYINTVTGNTSYERPEKVSSSKLQPLFQISITPNEEMGLPHATVNSSARITRGLQPPPTGNISAQLSDWNNPVFSVVAPDAACLEASHPRYAHLLHRLQFNKAMLSSMKVLCQIDQKFISCVVRVCENVNSEVLDVKNDIHDHHQGDYNEKIYKDDRMTGSKASSVDSGSLLILVDQHVSLFYSNLYVRWIIYIQININVNYGQMTNCDTTIMCDAWHSVHVQHVHYHAQR